MIPDSDGLSMTGSNMALYLSKFTQDGIAINSNLSFSISSLNASNSNTTFQLDLSDPIFSQDSTIIVKAIIVNKSFKANSTNSSSM